MARFGLRTASSLRFGGMGVSVLFHSILSKIVAYYFEYFGWKLKNYVYQHLEIVCKCWLYLVNTRSVVQSKKESCCNKKGSVLNLILS